MQLKLAVAVENFGDMRQIGEAIINAFHGNHGLLALINRQRHVLKTLCGNIYLRQLANLCQHGVVGCSGFSHDGHDLKLRVKVGKEVGNKVLKAVENRHDDNQCHRSDGHSCD